MSGTATTIVLVAVFVGIIVYDLATSLLRHVVRAKADALFATGDFDLLDRYLQRGLPSFVLGRYGTGIARFNAYVQRGDGERAERLITELLGARVPVRQRHELIVKAFNFYLEQGDYTPAKELLPEIRQTLPQETGKNCEMSYNILARHSHSYIQELKDEFPRASKMRQLEFAYLLSAQYRNLGNHASQETWQRKFERLAKDLGTQGPSRG